MKSKNLKDIEIKELNPNGYFVLQDGELLELLKIRAIDLNSLSTEENEYIVLKWAKIHKLNAPDIKVVCMNFPCDTTRQQIFLERKMQNTKNEIHRETLSTYLEELRWLQQNDTTRNFYLMTFASSDEEMDNAVRRWKENLGIGKNGLLSEVDVTEKIEVYHNLLNKGILFQ